MENMQKIMAGVLLILVLVSAVQTYQLSKLGATVKSGGSGVSLVGATAASSGSGGPSSGSASASLPGNLQNLPSQVGGC